MYITTPADVKIAAEKHLLAMYQLAQKGRKRVTSMYAGTETTPYLKLVGLVQAQSAHFLRHHLSPIALGQNHPELHAAEATGRDGLCDVTPYPKPNCSPRNNYCACCSVSQRGRQGRREGGRSSQGPIGFAALGVARRWAVQQLVLTTYG